MPDALPLPVMSRDDSRPVAVLGATGYIGARLVPRLLAAGWRVRAIGRNPAKLAGRPRAADPRVEIVPGDVLDRPGLEAALRGCQAAFYLVHSMNPQAADFAATDRLGAENMAVAAAAAGIGRIIYLSGLGDDNPQLSHHLRCVPAAAVAEGLTRLISASSAPGKTNSRSAVPPRAVPSMSLRLASKTRKNPSTFG